MKVEVNQKVWEIKINKIVDAKSDLYKNGVTIDEYKILGVSHSYICLNDNYFSKFSVLNKGDRKQYYNSYLDVISVNIKTKEDYFGRGILITLYSTKKPTKKILNKMVATASVEIDSTYGFLFSDAKDDLYNMVDDFKL